MRPLEYLRILRQRWWVLPIAALVGFSLAFATQPSTPNAVARRFADFNLYRATHTLFSVPDRDAQEP